MEEHIHLDEDNATIKTSIMEKSDQMKEKDEPITTENPMKSMTEPSLKSTKPVETDQTAEKIESEILFFNQICKYYRLLILKL